MFALLTGSGVAQQQAPAVSYRETVTVLGEAEPMTEGQASRSVEVLPVGPVENLLSEPAGLLREDGSVDVQMRGPMGVQTDVSLRGGSFEQTLVLLNGLRINDAQTAHFNLDIPVPLAGIAGMDVLHGAGSTLYGSDAISGAINVRTLRPEATSLRLRTAVGSYGINQQMAQAAAVGRRASGVLTGERDFSTGFIPDRDYRSESVAGEEWVGSRLGTTEVLGALSDRSYGAAQFYGDYPSWERTKGWFVTGTQELGQRTAVSAAYRRHTDVFDLYREQPAVYENNHLAESVQVVLRRKDAWGRRVRVFTGVDNNLDQIRSSALGQHGRNRGAGYAEVDLRWGRASVSGALREEVVGGYGVVSAPGFSGAVFVRKRLKARGSVGYGFRLPTFTDKYYSDPTTRPNPGLRPESAWSYDGGLDWYATDRVALSATGYTSRQTGAIDYVRAAGEQGPYQAQNLANLQLSGAEVGLHASLPRGGRLFVSYTSVTGAQSVLRGLESRYLYNFASHNGSAEWVGSARGVIWRLRVGATQRFNRNAYATMDVSLARERGVVRPYLQMTNLTNTGYEEIAGVRMQGRAFVGGVDLRLFERTK